MIWKILSQIEVDPSELKIPQGDLSQNSVATALELVFGVAGAIALLIMVIAGLRYTLSQGDPQSINKSKNAIIYAAIGLVICATAFVIVRFIVRSLTA
jgi:ABC-type sulfate transport system permease subunit